MCTLSHVTALKNGNILRNFTPAFEILADFVRKTSLAHQFQPPSGQIMNCSLMLPLASVFFISVEIKVTNIIIYHQISSFIK